jgi:iron complex outermembrane receptor protein
MHQKLFYSVIFLLLIVGLHAQNSTISGKVLSKDGQPAEFVTVGLKGTKICTLTDGAGLFRFPQLPAGSYTVVMSNAGIIESEQTLDLGDNEQKDLGTVTLEKAARELDEVTVNAVRNQNEIPVAIGKMNIKPMDLPQSVASIGKEVLEQQQTQNMSDALKNFNGVYLMGNTGGVQQEIAARGFALSSSNTFKNGIRFNNGILPEMSSLEKVEIMKGSSAVLFGNVAAGGVLNLVTKKPTYTTGGEISMRAGSYDLYKPMIDLYGVLDQKNQAAFRLNTTYQNSGSFRDNVKSDRIYFNPSLAVKLSPKNEVLIEGDYLKDKRTSDFGVGAINYALIDIPRERFLGAAWSYNNTEQKSLTASLTHRFSRNWQIKSTNGLQQFENELFGTMRPNSNNQYIKESGKWIRGLQRTTISEQYLTSQLDLTGKFNTGNVKHNLLIGADIDGYSTNTTAYNNLNRYDSINVFNLDLYKQRNDIPDLTKRISTETPQTRGGAYIQDLVDFGKIKLLAGARFSYLETGSKIFTYATGTFSRTIQYDHATTPRIGAIYQPSKKLSIFGSYANSFTPNTGVDISGKQLAPSYINQVEAGIKSSILKDKLTANITAYQIRNSNLAQTSLINGNTNTNIKELAGEVTSKGVEVDIMTRSFNGFMVIAGYSYNETRYTKSNTYIVGSLLRYNPMHTANSSIYYTVQSGKARGLNLGLSCLYFGERQAGRSTRVTVENDTYKLITLPAYTLLDASLGYTYRQTTIRFKASNLLNALSYNVHDDNSVNPIEPRQFSTTISYKF